MKLTLDEIGDDQWAKAHSDRARFRGSPAIARGYAAERGGIAVLHLQSLQRAVTSGDYSETARLHFAADAELFARMAFKGWRAYRLMKGE